MNQKIIYHGRDLIENGRDFVVAKVTDTCGVSPRKRGAWLLLTQDGDTTGSVGGGVFEAEVLEAAKAALRAGTSTTLHLKRSPETESVDGWGCGGDADVRISYVKAADPGTFVEDFSEETTAFLFGAGHVAQALEPLLRHVDFSTVVIDDRPEYANRQRFPEARDVVVCETFTDACRNLTTDENSFFVVVTRGHAGDYEVLRGILRKPSAYVGMLGSQKKIGTLLGKLRDEGFSDADVARIHTPIGLPIHAETPEEIAVSIVAEMIRARAGYDGEN
jgi:xanthine dehydrogenase accessory factor